CIEIENETGCKHPHRCMTRAKALMDTLHPKWDPRSVLQPQKYEEQPSTMDDFDEIDSNLTTYGDLADVFRVFTG
ncbi:hypothetical protein L218DRAFT_836965, partial [Marasmius fiardii PR-910]